MSRKDVLPNSNDDSYPFFSTFTELAFAQTMLLFVESVLSLTLWFSSGKLLWFLRTGKHKASNENGAKIKPEEANEKVEEENEEAVNFYKVRL